MEEVGNEDLAVTNPGRYAGMGIMISGTVRSRHAGFEIGRLSRRSDNGLPGLDSRRCFVYELLLTREKFYEEADYVWRRTGTGPQSSGHGCVRDTLVDTLSSVVDIGSSSLLSTPDPHYPHDASSQKGEREGAGIFPHSPRQLSICHVP